MRKTTFLTNLGLAVLLGVGVAVSAQPPANARPSADAPDATPRGRRGPGGPGGPGGRGAPGILLRGITLTDAQQQQVAALRDAQRERVRAGRAQPGARRGETGDAGRRRERPDSATIAARRQQLAAQRTRDEAALRAILTPEQRRQFDANRAELAERMKARGAQGGSREGRGRHH